MENKKILAKTAGYVVGVALFLTWAREMKEFWIDGRRGWFPEEKNKRN